MIHRLAVAAAGPGGADVADAELLRRFADEHDETAFTLLVRRHGPMVLDVCRVVLGNHADAEDALQATFLVLARKAPSVRQPDSLAAWLHAVAYRVARKALAQACRRRAHEARAADRESVVCDEPTWSEVRETVHAALAALGERYRAPLVLCYLRGLTQDQAADVLGLSPAALKKRLERGRQQLRVALGRRGLGPTALLAVTALPAAPPLPPALAANTARAASIFVGGSTHAVAIPASVLRLVCGSSVVTRTAKLMLLVLPAALGLALVGGPGYPAPPGSGAAQELTPVMVRPADRPDTRVARETDGLAGVWKVRQVETNGKPLASPAQLANTRLTFKEGRVAVTELPLPIIGDFAFRLGPTRRPKEIDVTFLAGPLEDRTFQGIYVIRQDEARICLRLKHPEHGRPKGFYTVSGDTLYTLILDRATPSSPPATAPPRR
jgi:RNA polymerase sigma factor (sigma-70 family)